MLVLNCRVSIGKYEFAYAAGIEIEQSVSELTGKCKLTLPRVQTGVRPSDLFVPGDAVTIEIGYAPNYTLVFSGWLHTLKAHSPLELECEDDMWQLKRKTFNVSGRGFTLRRLLALLWGGPIRCPETPLGTFRTKLKTPNGAQILEQLKETYGIRAFFRRGTLVAGLVYDPATAHSHLFAFRQNIISDELEFCSPDQVRLKVTATDHLANGKKKTVTLGDGEGEARTLNFFNLGSETALRCAAAAEMKRLRYAGYRGHFTTFGEPVVTIGDLVDLYDPEYPERGGSYWVDAVKTSYGTQGIRQEITLGPMASTEDTNEPSN